MMLARSLVLTWVAVVGVGCLPLTHLDTGRTVEKGKTDVSVRLTSGVSEGTRRSDGDLLTDPGRDDDYLYWPAAAVRGAHGVGARTEVGFQFSANTYAGGHVKYQWLGTQTSPFASSVGLEGGGNLTAFVFGGSLLGYAGVPVSASYHPSESVALFASTRYTILGEQPVLPPPPFGESRDPSLLGFPTLSYGATYGQRLRVGVEVSHVEQLRAVQVGVGFFVRFD